MCFRYTLLAVKRGLTPMNLKLQLYDMVVLVFSGLHEEGSEIIAGKGGSRFLTEKIYQVIHQLSSEFPDFFPVYRNDHLEDILSRLGVFGVVSLCGSGMRFQEISPEMKKALAANTLKDLGGDRVRKLLPVVKCFNDLMAKD